jgi:hypothetical protein
MSSAFVEKVRGVLRRAMPVRTQAVWLDIDELARAPLLDANGDLVVRMRLVTWEQEDGRPRMRDVQMAEIRLARAEHLDHMARFEQYMQAWAAAARSALKNEHVLDWKLDDLVFPDLLEDESLQSAEQFLAELTSRLGKH